MGAFLDLPLYKAILAVNPELVQLLLLCGNHSVFAYDTDLQSELNIIYDEEPLNFRHTYLHHALATYEKALENSPQNSTKIESLREIFKQLLIAGVLPTRRVKYDDARQFLHYTAQMGYVDLVQVLLSMPQVDVNVVDDRSTLKNKSKLPRAKNSLLKDPPLHFALSGVIEVKDLGLQQRYREIIKQLLEKGADVNAKDFFGLTPMARAVEIAKNPQSRALGFEIINLLLDKQANLNVLVGMTGITTESDTQSYSLLSWAIYKQLTTNDNDLREKSEILVNRLINDISLGVDVNFQCTSERITFDSALELAIRNFKGEIALVKNLFKKGAVPSDNPGSSSAKFLDNATPEFLAENPEIQKAKFISGLNKYKIKMERWYNYAWMRIKAFFNFRLTFEKYNLAKAALNGFATALQVQAEWTEIKVTNVDPTEHLISLIITNTAAPQILNQFDNAHTQVIINQKGRKGKDNNNLDVAAYKGRLKKLTT